MTSDKTLKLYLMHDSKFKTFIITSSCYFCVCVKRITLCNCLCSSCPSSSRDFASVIRNIGKKKSEQKNYFKDCRTANIIYEFSSGP